MKTTKDNEVELTKDEKNNLKMKHPSIDEMIIDNFPFPHARGEQLELIDEIIDAFSDHKYVILEAGMGIGKSAIGTTVARIMTPSYILTVNKQLQEQYREKFGFSVVKGRNNFQCLVNGLSCEDDKCQDMSINNKFKCPHDIDPDFTSVKTMKDFNRDYFSFFEPNFSRRGDCEY